MKKLLLIFVTGLAFSCPAQGMERIKSWLGYAKNKESTVSLSQECAICYEPLKTQPPEPITILGCHDKHIFHHKCVGNWVKTHATCPLCRAYANLSIEEKEEKANPAQVPAAVDNSINSQNEYDDKIIGKVFRHASLIASLALIAYTDEEILKNPMTTNTVLGKAYYFLGMPLLQFFIMRKMTNFAEALATANRASKIKCNLKNALIFPAAFTGGILLLKTYANKFPNTSAIVDFPIFVSCLGLYQHAIVTGLEYTNK